MDELQEKNSVRVVQLLPQEHITVGERPPAVGDDGIVHHILRDANGRITGYVVECQGPEGKVEWLAVLRRQELERRLTEA